LATLLTAALLATALLTAVLLAPLLPAALLTAVLLAPLLPATLLSPALLPAVLLATLLAAALLTIFFSISHFRVSFYGLVPLNKLATRICDRVEMRRNRSRMANPQFHILVTEPRHFMLNDFPQAFLRCLGRTLLIT
jgi:hypothetical protein